MSINLTTEQLFGEHSNFFLPDFLNKLGVTAEQFTSLRIMNKPHLVKALLYHFRRHVMRKTRCHLAEKIRHYRMTGSAIDDVGNLLKLAEVDPRDSSAIASGAVMFRQMMKDIVRASSIYDRVMPGAEKSTVQSVVVGTFSYEGTDYDQELENYSLVQCPCCDHEETVYDGNEADNAAVKLADEFEHLSGPYARCSNCRKVVRPHVGPAQDMPMHAMVGQDDTDNWEWYKGQLQDHIDTMLSRLSRLTGYPAPCRLQVDIGNADWRGRDAYTSAELTGESLAQVMSVNSDFHIMDGKLLVQPDNTVSMTCLLVHHDATSRVTAYPVWECQIDNDTWIVQEDMADAVALAEVAETLLCGEYDCHEYSRARHPLDRFAYVSRGALCEKISDMMVSLGYGTKPWDMNKLLEEPGESPVLDLIAYNLFFMEDLILIKKRPVSIVAFHAEMVARALNDYLTLENSDAT